MIDQSSQTWEAIKKFIDGETESALFNLQQPGVSERVADAERGKLIILRDLNELGAAV